MTESANPKCSFTDRAFPVGEALRLVRNEGRGADADEDGNPEICLTAAMGIVRAMESSLAEFETRHRLALETVRDLICHARRSIGADREASGELSVDAV